MYSLKDDLLMNSLFVNRKISISYSLHFKFHHVTFPPKSNKQKTFIWGNYPISKRYLFWDVRFFWKFLDCKREALIATKILFCDEVCDNFSVTIRNYRMSSLKSIKSEICEADAIYRVITNFWFNVKLRKKNLKLWILWTNFEFPRLVQTLKIVLGLISDVDRLLE